jgi:hypothetical protein
MDTINTENLLVVQQPDGTLATRQVASLPPPPGDTTRTLQSDLLLTTALCNCTDLPPAMIQSLLNNGYTIQDLLGFEISISNLLEGGVNPMDLLDLGVPLNSIYGKNYAGGLIFYLDTMNAHPFDGLVALDMTFSVRHWGCTNTLVGTTSSDIGAGQANTTDIINTCNGDAATFCGNIDNGYNDWFLPSKDELNLMYVNLHLSGLHSFPTGAPYWSSTEINFESAWLQGFATGAQQTKNKSIRQWVHAVRAF